MDNYYEIHIMNIKPSPFEKMASGRKTVELRLFDDKRRNIDISDRIIFTNLEDPYKKTAVKVKSLHRYATFEDLFKDIPLEKCGHDITETSEGVVAEMKRYYSNNQIKRYGVLGFEIELDDLDIVQKRLEEHKEAVFEHWFPDGMK